MYNSSTHTTALRHAPAAHSLSEDLCALEAYLSCPSMYGPIHDDQITFLITSWWHWLPAARDDDGADDAAARRAGAGSARGRRELHRRQQQHRHPPGLLDAREQELRLLRHRPVA